ncbi:MAG: class I SAM-dependent methyltransferase [Acidobacteriota bacterium]
MTAGTLRPLQRVYRFFLHGAIRTGERLGLTVSRVKDYYSPLPVRAELLETRERWDRPSALAGVEIDLEAQRALHRELMDGWYEEYADLLPYDEAKALGYGPGFTIYDAMWLYLTMRRLKPRRYIEIGSGLSTWYALQAFERNAAEGSRCRATAIDPYASGRTRTLEGLEILDEPVQSTPLERFAELEDGDVLFIDSTHVVKIDGDVPRLYLDVVPSLNPGVVVHAHDIHFPYNTPFPAEQYIARAKWPYFWTEAMLLQAFLSGNRDFEILLSGPLLRHHDEGFLRDTIPEYRAVEVGDHDTHYGSLWFRRRPKG